MDYIDITSENMDQFLPEADQWILDNISRGRFYAVGAKENGAAVGAIVYTMRKADEDGGNIGVLYHLSGDDDVKKSLLESYTTRCDGLDLQYTIVETTDKKQADFYGDYGFDMEESESIRLVFNVTDLERIEPFKTMEIPSVICPLSQASPIEFRYFLQEYRESVNLNPYFDIESTPMSWYDNDVSCISMNAEGIDAAFLVHYDGKNTVTTELLAGFGNQYTKKIPYLLACSATNAMYTYTPDTKVIVYRNSKHVSKITDKVLNGMKGEKAYHGVLSEALI